jgi:hypothetical protein
LVLDFRKVERGEAIAGVAGAALLIVMLVFTWFAIKEEGVLALPSLSHPHTVIGSPRNAFEAFSVTDLVLLVTALAAMTLLLLSAAQARPRALPTLSALVALLGIASVILIVLAIINPPDLTVPGGFHVSDADAEGVSVVRRIGVWLGLVAAGGVAYGGIRAARAYRIGAPAATASPRG